MRLLLYGDKVSGSDEREIGLSVFVKKRRKAYSYSSLAYTEYYRMGS